MSFDSNAETLDLDCRKERKNVAFANLRLFFGQHGLRPDSKIELSQFLGCEIVRKVRFLLPDT